MPEKNKKPWKRKDCEDPNRHFSKEGKELANKHIKNTQHSSLLEKYKSNLLWGIMSLLSERPSFQIYKQTNIGEDEKETVLCCW